jgi:hypothetical protein
VVTGKQAFSGKISKKNIQPFQSPFVPSREGGIMQGPEGFFAFPSNWACECTCHDGKAGGAGARVVLATSFPSRRRRRRNQSYGEIHKPCPSMANPYLHRYLVVKLDS